MSQYAPKFDLFPFGQRDDSPYLERWRGAALTYRVGQTLDASWHHDDHEIVVAERITAAVYERAAGLLLRYQFYPPQIMAHVSDFSREGRRMRPGDRIVQRIHGPALLGLRLLDGITMNEVTAVTDQPRRAGFTYITTEAHAEQGEWSAQIEWSSDNSLLLTIHSISRLALKSPFIRESNARTIQLRAHHLGMEYFKALVLAA
jgi:uncharacterized protein (UPF0548 family)